MYGVEFTVDAVDDLRWFKRADRRRIVERLEEQLAYEPTTESRNRKRLRPNQLAEWEFRIDRFRVFYDVDSENQVIKVEAVGYKEGNSLCIRGEAYQL
jgi:mRNA-degrading endonuclease RelE of RelBE toxin-antitoxin system